MIHFALEKKVALALHSNGILFKLSLIFSYSLYPVFIFWLVFFYMKRREIFSLMLCMLAVLLVCVYGIKHLTSVPRPYEVYGVKAVTYHIGSSFPSTHASLSLFIFLTSVMFAGRVMKRSMKILLFLWAMLVSISRWVLLLHYLVDIVAGWVISLTLVLICWSIWNERIESEKVRKGIHIGLGYLIGLVVWKYADKVVAYLAVITAASMVASVLIKRQTLPEDIMKLIENAERGEDIKSFPLRGVVFFFLSATIVTYLFPSSIAASGIVALSLGDGMATVVGRKLGRVRLPYNRAKSFEGTLSCFFFSFVGSLPFLPGTLAFLNGIIASLVESLPHREHSKLNMLLDDNLTIPIICCCVLYFLCINFQFCA